MRRLIWCASVLAAVLGLSACGPTLTSLPLPGSGVSGKTITVNANFANALNLAQGAAVRINGVTSGRVQSVTASNFTAHVTMRVQTAANLRANATVRLRYTTPLGELYLEVANPDRGPLMANNGTLGLRQTATAPTVEDALAAASLLINGGGLNQLQTIVSEANRALDGNQGNIRAVITRAADSERQLYESGGDITRTLTALNAVSQSLSARREIIHGALAGLGPAADALHANTANFTSLLSSLNKFANTANKVVGTNKAAMLRIVRQAQPLLQEVVNVRGQLAPTLNAIISLSRSLNTAIPGDYLNLFLTLDVGAPATSAGAASHAGTTHSPGNGGARQPGRSGSGILSGIPIIGGLL